MVQTRLLSVTTQHLEYLVAASTERTWADAAAALGVSGSALSQGLAEIERRIGLALFERSGRNRVLTQAGTEAVEHAKRILAATTDMTLWAQAAKTGNGGQVRLGLIDLAAVHHFPSELSRFKSEFPEVELHLTVAPSAHLLQQLTGGHLDAALVVTPETSDASRPETTFEVAVRDELAVYQPPGATQTSDPSSWGPWVTFPSESHTRRHIARALRRLGCDFRVEAESNQPEVLRQLVHLGLGWTVLPVVQAEDGPDPLRRARPEPLLSRDIAVARRRGAVPPVAAAELISRLLDSSSANR